MVVIGLTGGIGSGKSTVSRMLHQLGAVILEADQVGHEVLKPHTEAWRDVVAAFGPGILTPEGEVDRGKLSEVVFNDAQALARLNRITHPRIGKIVRERFEHWRQQGTDVVVLEAAILLGTKWTSLVDEIWVTAAPEATVIERVGKRTGLTPDQIRARIGSQLPLEDRVKQADVVIDTDHDLAEVRAEVEGLWRRIMARAGKGRGETAPDTNRVLAESGPVCKEAVKEKIRRILAGREIKRIDAKHLTPAAVLLPLYNKEGECHVLLTKRTEMMENHKGQISFPGGARNARDETLMDTALRECTEEIGVAVKDVEVLGKLDELVTQSSNYVVSPFVAFIPYPYPFRPNRYEVQQIIEVPLAALLDKGNLREEIEFDEGHPSAAYFYEYSGQVIWGATARILKQFLDLVFQEG